MTSTRAWMASGVCCASGLPLGAEDEAAQADQGGGQQDGAGLGDLRVKVITPAKMPSRRWPVTASSTSGR
ncbi:hypothetical protein ACRAWD_18815 [Caulobacter segnis]